VGAFLGKLHGLEVHFGNQRAGGVDDGEVALFGFRANCRRYAVGTENRSRAGRNFGKLFHEDGAEFAQFVDDMLVVDNFFADVDRRAVEIQGNLDHVDSAYHTGTKAARLQEIYLFFAGGIGKDGFQ